MIDRFAGGPIQRKPAVPNYRIFPGALIIVWLEVYRINMAIYFAVPPRMSIAS
jgi:hypothetical protein